MQEYIDLLIDLLNNFIITNQAWAGPVIFLLCFGESILIIGFILPATPILMATGVLIGVGSLSPWPILIWGIIGAILGDAVSYYIGRWLGWDITKKRIFVNYRPFFVKARLFFKKYGTLSVFLGRFLGPIRSTIPTVAGIMGLSHIKFQIANVASAILWLPIMLLTGFLVAKGVTVFSSPLFTIALIVLGVGVVLYLFASRKKQTNASKTVILHRSETKSSSEVNKTDEPLPK